MRFWLKTVAEEIANTSKTTENISRLSREIEIVIGIIIGIIIGIGIGIALFVHLRDKKIIKSVPVKSVPVALVVGSSVLLSLLIILKILFKYVGIQNSEVFWGEFLFTHMFTVLAILISIFLVLKMLFGSMSIGDKSGDDENDELIKLWENKYDNTSSTQEQEVDQGNFGK